MGRLSPPAVLEGPNRPWGRRQIGLLFLMMGSMSPLTAFVLRHRRLVMLAWLVVAVAGFAHAGIDDQEVVHRVQVASQPSYIADSKIDALYHGEGGNVPIVVAVTAPASARCFPQS